MTNKVVMSAVGQIDVLPNKKVVLYVNLPATRMIEIKNEEFEDLISSAVFGHNGFEIEGYEAVRVTDDKNIVLEIKGNIKNLLKNELISIIDKPKLVL